MWQMQTGLHYAFGGKALGLGLSVVYAAYRKQALAGTGNVLPPKKQSKKAIKQS